MTVRWSTRLAPGHRIALAAVLAGCAAGEEPAAPDADDRADVLVDAALDAPEPMDLNRPDLTPLPDGPIDEACMGRTVVGQRTPVDLLVMLDRSGSMLLPTTGGRSKWDAVTEALSDFVRAPSSAG